MPGDVKVAKPSPMLLAPVSNRVWRAELPLSWDLEPPATVGNNVTGDRRPLIDVTEPRAHLKHETLEPLVLQLRERKNVSVEVEILAVGVDAQVIVAGSDGGHGKLGTPDPARNADAAKRPIIPVKYVTPAG